MKIVDLKKANDNKHKYIVILKDNNREYNIKFGAEKYEDYTMHKDEKRKKAYLIRHQKNEDWNDPLTSGFWSRWLLWNLPTLKESLADVIKKYNL